MSKDMTPDELAQALIQFIQEHVPMSFTGEVVDVSEAESKGIVKVKFNKLTYKVRLKSIVDNNSQGIFVVPVEGSMVYCVPEHTATNRYVMAKCNTWSKIIISSNNVQMVISDDDDEIKLNDGSLGGLVVISDLVSKLNTLESDINTLKNVFSGWAPVSQDGGTALKTAASTWAGSSITETTEADIENERVKHG